MLGSGGGRICSGSSLFLLVCVGRDLAQVLHLTHANGFQSVMAVFEYGFTGVFLLVVADPGGVDFLLLRHCVSLLCFLLVVDEFGLSGLDLRLLF